AEGPAGTLLRSGPAGPARSWSVRDDADCRRDHVHRARRVVTHRDGPATSVGPRKALVAGGSRPRAVLDVGAPRDGLLPRRTLESERVALVRLDLEPARAHDLVPGDTSCPLEPLRALGSLRSGRAPVPLRALSTLERGPGLRGELRDVD